MEGEKSIQPLNASVCEPHPTAYAAGCCVLIRRSVFERIGMFDPRYFAYDEDVDLSYRAWMAGYDVYKVPSSIVYHKGGVTLPSIRQMTLGYRNQLYTLFKNYEVPTLKRFSRSIIKRWVFTRNRYALSGTITLLRSFGETVRLRREVQALRVRSDEEIFELSGLII
jgi:GT2 family glycosyltransferase